MQLSKQEKIEAIQRWVVANKLGRRTNKFQDAFMLSTAELTEVVLAWSSPKNIEGYFELLDFPEEAKSGLEWADIWWQQAYHPEHPLRNLMDIGFRNHYF